MSTILKLFQMSLSLLFRINKLFPLFPFLWVQTDYRTLSAERSDRQAGRQAGRQAVR